MRDHWPIKLALALVLPCTVAWPCDATDVDYDRDVRPILTEHCLPCHGPDEQQSKFRVDQARSLLRGGDSGEPAILPGDSANSHLILLVTRGVSDLVMPPEGDRLTATQVSKLRAWIDQGAEMADGEVQRASTTHWSFQPLRRAIIPPVSVDGAISAIDRFVLAKLTESGLTSSPPADRVTLIRRVYLLLLGLPPTPREVHDFVHDARADAYPRLVDRVLSSPRYGERWAQHWLDLVRFGETHGFETNRERPNAWHYRDYVIDALNADKPYDQFVREQLAGDAVNADAATGFLVAGPHDLVKSPDINLTLMQRQDELGDIINTSGTAFLGLTLGCARCHNHKFDPITQTDFYALQAVFAGVRHAERPLPLDRESQARLRRARRKFERARTELDQWMEQTGYRPPVHPRHNAERFAPTAARFVRFSVLETNTASQPCLDELEVFSGEVNVALASHGAIARCSSELPGYQIHKLEHINDGQYGNSRSWISNEAGTGWVEIEFSRVETIERITWGRDRDGEYQDRLATRYVIEAAVEPGNWRPIASSDDRLPPANGTLESPLGFPGLSTDKSLELQRLIAAVEEAQQRHDRLDSVTLAYVGQFEQPGPTHRLYRGDPTAKREVVVPDALAVIGSMGLDQRAPEQTRRLALAEWMVDASIPLTARVIANRVWQHLFGTGIVATPSDFGANGSRPSHPELLDWLASELIDSGWSIKHLQRAILLSSTFQQSSQPRPDALSADASSRLYWRFPPRRLEAEAIRDSILYVTGVLDQRMGGPGFSGFDVEMENVRHYFPKESFGPEDWRRMIYMTKVRQEREAVFGVLDCPDLSQVTPVRGDSTTPLQALSLFNSPFMLQQSELLAKRLEAEAGDDRSDQIRLAFCLCFQRLPADKEQPAGLRLTEQHGLTAFCRAMLNANELLFIP